MLLETLTLDCSNFKQCLAHDSIKNNLKFYGGAIFRLAKPKCQITGFIAADGHIIKIKNV